MLPREDLARDIITRVKQCIKDRPFEVDLCEACYWQWLQLGLPIMSIDLRTSPTKRTVHFSNILLTRYALVDDQGEEHLIRYVGALTGKARQAYRRSTKPCVDLSQDVVALCGQPNDESIHIGCVGESVGDKRYRALLSKYLEDQNIRIRLFEWLMARNAVVTLRAPEWVAETMLTWKFHDLADILQELGMSTTEMLRYAKEHLYYQAIRTTGEVFREMLELAEAYRVIEEIAQ